MEEEIDFATRNGETDNICRPEDFLEAQLHPSVGYCAVYTNNWNKAHFERRA